MSSATAPLLVVLAAGLLERVPLAKARWWQRAMAIGGLVFVVGAAFVTSYQHQHELLRRYGNPELSAILLPLAVDAMVMMSSVCLAVIAALRQTSADMSDTVTAPVSATVSDTAPVTVSSQARTSAVIVSDTVSDTPTPIQQPKRGRKQPTTGQRIAMLRDRHPDMSVSAIARRLELSERTVHRYLREPAVSDTAATPTATTAAAPLAA